MNNKESEYEHGQTSYHESSILSCHESTPLVKISEDVFIEDKVQEKVLLAKTKLPLARRLLYITHLFARFSDVSWQFCLVIFLAAFTDYESIVLVSTYGFLSGLTIFLLASRAGRFIDSSNRLIVAQRFIWMENIFVILASACCYLLLTKSFDNDLLGNLMSNNNSTLESNANEGSKPTNSWLWSRLDGVPVDVSSILLLIGIHLFGSGAEVLSRGFLVSLERDWIVVMAQVASPNYGHTQSNNPASFSEDTKSEGQIWLSETNVTMKQIDLSAQIGSPAIAGFFLTFMGNYRLSTSSPASQSPEHGSELGIAAISIGMLNVLALIVEYACTIYIYRLIPELAYKEHIESVVNVTPSQNKTNDPLVIENDNNTNEPLTSKFQLPKLFTAFGNCIPSGFQIYMRQPIAWSGIGFALLYLNVLCFGAIMTSYLIWRGMRFSTVGIWRGVSSAIGLLGTFAYYISSKYLSLKRTGMWSICFQFGCLTIAYGSLFVEDYMTSLTMLIAGVCTSRVGLWVFDITMTQLFQEYVHPSVRGVVGGVQESLNAFFGLIAFVLGICVPDPQNFHIYVSIGYASVGICMLVYTFSIFIRREIQQPILARAVEA
jgi:solute carrier family 40 (iron-regulated transporter), member 1